MPSINTKRLTLLPLSLEYLETCLTDYKQMEANLGLEITDTRLSEGVRSAISWKILKIAENPAVYVWNTYWLIIHREENMGIGLIGFKGAPNSRSEVEIGYGTHPPYQRQGFMTEAASALIEWAFEQRPDLTVLAETEKTNLPSQKVLTRLGFEKFLDTELTYLWKRPGPEAGSFPDR